MNIPVMICTLHICDTLFTSYTFLWWEIPLYTSGKIMEKSWEKSIFSDMRISPFWQKNTRFENILEKMLPSAQVSTISCTPGNKCFFFPFRTRNFILGTQKHFWGKWKTYFFSPFLAIYGQISVKNQLKYARACLLFSSHSLSFAPIVKMFEHT